MVTPSEKAPLFGIRHLQALLLFFNITVVYVSRLNISVALVAMTNANTTNPDFPEFDWNEQQKSYVLSSFYWGYVLTQFPGGYLSRRFGAKITILVATFASAVCSCITPAGVRLGGWPVFCVIRLLQGLFQGVIFPAIHDHLAKWSPLHERNLLGALSLSGTDSGTVVALASSGLIASSSLGWPGISYVSASLCFAWCAVWLVFAADNAPSSKFITSQECKYIETSLERNDDFHKRRIPVPWRAIFTSVPFLAFLVGRCAEAWGFTTLQSQIPSYMNGVLNMEIKKNGLFSALPYLTMWFSLYIYLAIANLLTKRNILSLTAMRKTINTISLWIPSPLLIGIGFLDSSQPTLAIVLMTLNIGINGGSTIGSTLNSIDLAPNHAGILMGLSNTIVNIVPILSPLLVGVIVTDNHNRTQWQIIFAIAAVIFFLGNLFYIIWGTSETQPWNSVDFHQEKDAEKTVCKQVTVGKAVEHLENVQNEKKEEIDDKYSSVESTRL
ncbi:PREDICTED: putative inorganic phosphate cotransporter isoform X1 [Bactrocera latifrons]|uniref:putative inorganic phosphate cotransporter isoform X1 n=1 Tax=Bactrocera latifrons TaxID=174628 RepID=UPI0008DCD7A6|nr:PREDICTED: putative inorganic phosphate cotransporter isoform X1 [Bactrocera latifrons]